MVVKAAGLDVPFLSVAESHRRADPPGRLVGAQASCRLVVSSGCMT